MTREDIFKTVDHTLLAQTATWEEIKEICDDAIKFQTASVCIPASYVKRAKDYVDGKMAICTVIGFPNGYSTTAVKEYETKDAILNGADEIDMVINLGDVKDNHFDKIKGEIALLKSACGDKILKVIIETCLLTEEEKIKMCEIVTEAGADFIKTSTGFSTSGATFDDIALFKKYVGENVKIKGQTSVGQVMEISGKNATVAFGSIKTTVKIDRLERANHTPKTEGIAKSTFVSSQTHDQMYEKKLSFKQDIDVRGMRGDEALQAVTYFIDDAILVGMDRVRILHGTGTGILRTLIRQYLATVPGVSHYADEHVQIGGAGSTVLDYD